VDGANLPSELGRWSNCAWPARVRSSSPLSAIWIPQQAALSVGVDSFINEAKSPERVAERLHAAAETVRT
jgi:hypothetical protein